VCHYAQNRCAPEEEKIVSLAQYKTQYRTDS
jgi:hypothetical protein